MERWEKINAVQRMQDFIKEHINEDIKVDDVAKAAGYTIRHASRIFKELLGKTVLEYVRVIRLTESAKELLISEKNILNIAMDTHFDTHEGFLRAFSNEFAITPQKYRQEKPPVKYFVQYPVKHYYSYLYDEEKKGMDRDNNITMCTVTIVRKPKRKLILMRANKGHDYWSFCEEKGCDWEGLFNSIDCRLDNAAILELPNEMVVEGTTSCAAGVEIPENYSGKIPDGCDCVELAECDMLYFQSEPFDTEDEFGKAINYVNRAINSYNPQRYGYEYALNIAPKFNFGAAKEMGAKQAIPVRKFD